MEAKCKLCEFFGERAHCHNCKIVGNIVQQPPRELNCSLRSLVDKINSAHEVLDELNIGDYMWINLLDGQRVKIVLIDTDVDSLIDGSKAKTTFALFGLDGEYLMNHSEENIGGWDRSEMRLVRMPRFFNLLPRTLRQAIKPVTKKTTKSSYDRGDSNETTTDLLFLLGANEIFGTKFQELYNIDVVSTGYEYFNRISGIDSAYLRGVWTRTPYPTSSRHFLSASRHALLYERANCPKSVILGFCI